MSRQEILSLDLQARFCKLFTTEFVCCIWVIQVNSWFPKNKNQGSLYLYTMLGGFFLMGRTVKNPQKKGVWRIKANRSADLENICAVHATKRAAHVKMQYADTRSAPQVKRYAHIYTMGLAYLGNRVTNWFICMRDMTVSLHGWSRQFPGALPWCAAKWKLRTLCCGMSWW